jgi:hypothetical protein
VLELISDRERVIVRVRAWVSGRVRARVRIFVRARARVESSRTLGYKLLFVFTIT